MARDRQRAKQRRARRAAQPSVPKPTQPSVPKPTQPERENVPDELEHAGESDGFDAALVAGAGGEIAEPDATDAQGGVEHPEELSDEAFDELEDRVDDGEAEVDEQELERLAKTSAPAAPAAPAGATVTRRGPGRFIAFLRASWAELQRVQWPDRRQVGQATAVVLGFVVIAGAYLGLADALANEIVDFLI